MEFKNPLKGIFEKAKEKFTPTDTKTFIRIFSDSGVHFAEVQDRDVAKLALPEDTHHFKFFDRKMKKGEEPDTRTLFDKALNVSPTHYIVDRVLSLPAFKALPEEEKEEFSSALNLRTGPTTSIAITGKELRYLTIDENNVIAIDRNTMQQLWPPVEDGPKSPLKNAPKP